MAEIFTELIDLQQMFEDMQDASGGLTMLVIALGIIAFTIGSTRGLGAGLLAMGTTMAISVLMFYEFFGEPEVIMSYAIAFILFVGLIIVLVIKKRYQKT